MRSQTNSKEQKRSDTWRDWHYLETLAAAYAEDGQFDKAVRWQEKVIEAEADSRTRLDFYRQGKPYRENPNK